MDSRITFVESINNAYAADAETSALVAIKLEEGSGEGRGSSQVERALPLQTADTRPRVRQGNTNPGSHATA